MLESMPRDIDVEARLNDIAAATIRVARASGTHAVTIRAVARELGGSTTLVTNYLPSRGALIINVLDRANTRWKREWEQASQHLSAIERFESLITLQHGTDDTESVLRGLILEIVANSASEPVLRESLHRESQAFLTVLRDTAAEAGFADPDAAADIGYLLLRGAYFANAEEPGYWSVERTLQTALCALRALPRDAADHSSGRAAESASPVSHHRST